MSLEYILAGTYVGMITIDPSDNGGYIYQAKLSFLLFYILKTALYQ